MNYKLSGNIKFQAENGAVYAFPIPAKQPVQITSDVFLAIQTAFQSQTNVEPLKLQGEETAPSNTPNLDESENERLPSAPPDWDNVTN